MQSRILFSVALALSIVQQVIERAIAKSNDEKAIGLYVYPHGTFFHRACPAES